MNEQEIEACCACGEPTGKSGILDDSLYVILDGPYCEECFDIRTGDQDHRGE